MSKHILKMPIILAIFLLGLSPIVLSADDKVEKLINDLRSKNPDVREKAAMALGNIKDPKAVEPLIAILKDNDKNVRREAAWALGEIKDPRAVEPLSVALKDKDNDSEVHRKAAEALGEIKDPRAVKPLSAALKDGNWGVRMEAAKALGEIKDPRAVKPLSAALKDEDVRRYAVEALGKIGPPAVEPLITALKDEDKEVRRNAAKALGEIKDPRAVKPLIAALKDEDVRRYAVEALGKIGWKATNKTEEATYLIASEKWDELVKIGQPAVEPLIAALADNWDLRKEAAKILGEIKDPRAVEPLIAALKDGNSDVREGAAISLAKIGDKRAINPLKENLTDWYSSQTTARALSKLGWRPESDTDRIHLMVAQRKGNELKKDWEIAKKVLLMDVESNNYQVIENALYAFIAIGKNEIISILIEKLNTKGSKTMAEAYLNCGHKELDKAAKDWAARNGYTVSIGSGSHPVSWGSW